MHIIWKDLFLFLDTHDAISHATLVKADFGNMLAKHAVTNTVTSRQGTEFSLAEDWGGGLPSHSTTTHEHAAGTGSPSLIPFSQWPPSTWEKIQLLQMKERKNGKIITPTVFDRWAMGESSIRKIHCV